jgi:predicted ATPase
MKATLKIRDFGPIRDLNLAINKFNILIGPQASGKSTIAKVLCVIHSFDPSLSRNADEAEKFDELKERLAYYRIENFYRKTEPAIA